MGLPQAFKDAGILYWDYLQGKRGTPFPVTPTVKMIEKYEIHSIQVREFVPGASKKEKGYYLEPVPCEIYFDRYYVELFKEKIVPYYSVLSLLEANLTVDESDKFSEFEVNSGLILSNKNPRHSLYLKYKEFRNQWQP